MNEITPTQQLRTAIEEYCAGLESGPGDGAKKKQSALAALSGGEQISIEEQIALLDRHMQQLDEDHTGRGAAAASGESLPDIVRVEQWLRRLGRMNDTNAQRYAAALAEQGFGSLSFISQGEFSRRTLVNSFGVLPGHAAPILRAIQALPPPPPLPASSQHQRDGDAFLFSDDDDTTTSNDSDDAAAGGGGGGGGGGAEGEAPAAAGRRPGLV